MVAEGVPDMGTHPSPQATAQSLVNHPMFTEHLLCGSTILNAGDPAGSIFSTQSAFQVERSYGPSTCTHLALDQLIIPPYLEHIARPAAHSALGTMIAVAAGAVKRGVLHSQLRTVSGLTCEVHAAAEGRNQKVRGSFSAGPGHCSCKIKAHGLPLYNVRRPSLGRGEEMEGRKELA